MRILIVDDSGAARAIMRRMLADGDWEVVEAESGDEALRRLEDDPSISLALVDWHMHGMDGPELIRLVREHPAYDGIKMMIVTSETDERCVAEALESGADEYLMKPFTKEILMQKLELMDGDDV